MLPDKHLREQHVDVCLCLDTLSVFPEDGRELGNAASRMAKKRGSCHIHNAQQITASQMLLIRMKELTIWQACACSVLLRIEDMQHSNCSVQLCIVQALDHPCPGCLGITESYSICYH